MKSFADKIRPYARVALAIWIILIIVFAILPDLPAARIVKGNINIRVDHPIHFLEHTGLALLAMISYIDIGFRTQAKRAILLLLILITFAVASEFIQLLVPSRSFELLDMAMNVMGNFAGTLLAMLIYRRN
jgi:VanZ family protein